LALRGEMKETELQNRTLVKSMATTQGQFGLLAQATSGLFGAMAAGQGIMAMFSDGNENNAEAMKKAAKAQEALVIVMGLAEVARAAHEVGQVKTMITVKATMLADKLGITTKSALTAATVKDTAAKAAEAVATTAGAEANYLDLYATEADMAAKEAGTAVTKERATMQWIENAANSESVIAKTAAAAAQWVLNASYAPLLAIAGVILGIVAAYELLKDKTEKIAEILERQNKAYDAQQQIIKDNTQALKDNMEEEIKKAQLDADLMPKGEAKERALRSITEIQKKYTAAIVEANKADVDAYSSGSAMKQIEILDKRRAAYADLANALIENGEKIKKHQIQSAIEIENFQ
jgi:hypothetical protein